MDMPFKINADVNADLTRAVDEVAELTGSAHKGVKHILFALFGRWVADKERNALLQFAQNQVDAGAILRGEKIFESGVLMDVLKNDDIGNLSHMMALQKQIDEARCLLLALKDAAEKITERKEDEISDEPISKTFFNRWRKEVELVDDEALRDLWSRVLVEETCRPGSIALQTLEVIRRISKNEAATFQNVLKGSIDGMIPKDNQGHVQYGTYADILTLQDIGLIQTAGMTTRTFTGTIDIFGRQKCSIIRFNDCPLVFVVDGVFKVGCYTLSRAGIDISRIALIPRQQNEIVSTAEYLVKTAHPKEEISVHLAVFGDKGSFRLLPNALWSSKSVSVKG